MLREVRVALLEADVNFAVAKRFIASVKEKAIGEDIYGSLSADETIIKIVRDELTQMLGGEPAKFNWAPNPPTVILMVGLQGSGKTTTAAKLARKLKGESRQVSLIAGDVYRPAAIDQLETLGRDLAITVYADRTTTDVVKIARAGLDHDAITVAA